MRKKSEVCSLGLEFLNSNNAAEMAEILKNTQSKFVPTAEINNQKHVLQKIFLDGDQLTEERARNTQLANSLAETTYERLSGFETAFADWHLGKNLLMILFNVFVKAESASNTGTSYASMNRCGKTNAKKGPDNDYNSFKEFIDRETEGHVVAKWMGFAGIENFKGTPSKRPIPAGAHTWTLEKKSSWLQAESKEFLSDLMLKQEDFANRVSNLDAAHREGFPCRGPNCQIVFPLHSSRVRHELTQHPELDIENDGDYDRDSLGYYKCRNEDCKHVFTTNATRKRHEKQLHQEEHLQAAKDNRESLYKVKENNTNDNIYNYHNARLQCGLLVLNMMDAIKEGDGSRLVRCFKIVLLFDYKFKHTKYAYALLLFFAKVNALLSEKDAYLLVHNRFVNKKGKKAGNIPLDLHMEHLNLDVKKLLAAMGGKITQAAAQRCAQSITVTNTVMETVYNECEKSHHSGYHGKKNSDESVKSIATDLLQGKVFDYLPGRYYSSFKGFKSNILDIDYRDFFTWVKNHLKHWKAFMKPQESK